MNSPLQSTSISQAESIEEIAEFWDSHSLDDYWDETHEVEFEVRTERPFPRFLLTYKGYTAQVEFDADAQIFHGEVVNLRDIITFEAATTAELPHALAESVEDYLAFCAARNERPEGGTLRR